MKKNTVHLKLTVLFFRHMVIHRVPVIFFYQFFYFFFLIFKMFFFFFCSAAVACVGAFYEKMGRMLGSSFPDTINNLLKALKSAEVRVTFEDST